MPLLFWFPMIVWSAMFGGPVTQGQTPEPVRVRAKSSPPRRDISR
jgi:hypothetical protein